MPLMLAMVTQDKEDEEGDLNGWYLLGFHMTVTPPHFSDREMEAQRGKGTCQWSHSRARQFGSRVHSVSAMGLGGGWGPVFLGLPPRKLEERVGAHGVLM